MSNPPDLPSRLSSDHHRSGLAGLNANIGEPATGDTSLPPAAAAAAAPSDPWASPRDRLSIGDSPILAANSTSDPHHHHRTPSLGELHQELEQEQEAQVNRLLQMIRSQQAQLHQLQQQQPSQQASTTGTAVVDDTSTTPQSEHSTTPFPPIPPLPPARSRASTQLSSSLSGRRPSRPSSQAASPNLRPQASLHHLRGGPEGLESDGAGLRRSSRDETAFYQAEASMLSRENQMLRQRIRDLERQLSSVTSESAAESANEAVDMT